MEVLKSEPSSPLDNQNKKKRLKKITKLKKLSTPPKENNMVAMSLDDDISNDIMDNIGQHMQNNNIQQQQQQQESINTTNTNDSNSFNIEPAQQLQQKQDKKSILEGLAKKNRNIQDFSDGESDKNNQNNNRQRQNSLSSLSSVEDAGAKQLKKGDKGFSEDEDYQDESYEIEKQAKNKKNKLKKSNAAVKEQQQVEEKQDKKDYLKNIQQNDLFCMEEDDDIENIDGEDNNVGLELLAKEQQKQKEKQERKQRSRKKKDGPVLKNTAKTGNRLFGDISLADDIVQDDEQMVEEQCVIGQQLQFDKVKKPKLQLQQTNFFQKMQKVKLERGLQESAKKMKIIEENDNDKKDDNQNNNQQQQQQQENKKDIIIQEQQPQSQEQDQNNNNNQQQQNEILLSNKMEEEPEQQQKNELKQQLLDKINTLDKVMCEKDQLHNIETTATQNMQTNIVSTASQEQENNTQSQENNNNNVISEFQKPVNKAKHIEPKLFQRQNSDQARLERNFSSFSMESSSQNSNNNANSDELCDIQLSIPQIERQNSSNNSITSNTLFVSKFARNSNSQGNIFTSNLKLVNNASNSQPQNSNKNSLSAFQKQDRRQKGGKLKMSRDNFLKSILQDVNNKRKEINFDEAKESFQKTNFDHVNELFKDEKKKNQKQQNNNDKQQIQSDDEDEDNDDDFQINVDDDSNDNFQQDQSEDNDSKDQNKALDEEDYRKLIALEEGLYSSEGEIMEEEEEEEELEQEQDKQNQQLDQINEEDQTGDLDEVMSQPDDENEEDQNNQNNKKKLKKLGQQKQNKKQLEKEKKQKEKEQRRQKKMEKLKEQYAIMNDPSIKQALKNLYEDEAEQGSDNEENDDKVKQVDRAKELIEAGFNPDQDLDQECEEIIDRGEVQINEDAEKIAQQRMHRQILREDKELLQKIMDGDYRGAKKRKGILADQVQEDEMYDKKLKRMEDAMKMLEERDGGNSEYEDVVDDSGKKVRKKKRKSSRYDDEEKMMQIRMAELQMKRELDKLDKNASFDETKVIKPKYLGLFKQLSSSQQSSGSQQQQNSQSLSQSQSQNKNNNSGLFQNKLNNINKKHIQPMKLQPGQSQKNGNLLFNKQANKNSMLSAINNKNIVGMFKQSKQQQQDANQIVNLAEKQVQDSALASLYQDNSNSNTFNEQKQNSRKNLTSSDTLGGAGKGVSFMGLAKNFGVKTNNNNKNSAVGSSALNRIFAGEGGILNNKSPNKFIGFVKKKQQ